MKKTKAQPIISILVSYYNDQTFLKEHISSVIRQTYPHWELILLNHASTDNSREIARSFDDPRIKHIDYPINIGAMGGLLLKECLKQATGKYIKFFSADDYLLPNGLETLVNYMETHPEKDFAFGDVNYVDIQSRALGNSWFNSRSGFAPDLTEQEALKRFFDVASIYPFAGQIIRKKILKPEYLNNNFILLFDVNLWSALLLNGYKVGIIPTPVAGYRIHKDQMTSISKRQLVDMRFTKEVESYRRLFLSAPNLDMIRYLCADSPYVSLLENQTDLHFILGEYLLRKHNSVTGYLILNDLFEKEENVAYILRKFKFSMYNFRQLVTPFSLPTNFARKQARKYAKQFTAIQIGYMVVFKIQQILKQLFHRITHHKQDYSC